MRKHTSIQLILAACAVALSVAACTVTKNSDNTGTANNDVNLHMGDGSLNVDTPLFKMDKAGRNDKLHIDIPQMKIESK